MRILLFPSSYPPVLGGLQTVAHNLARQLIARGHDVRVVSNRYPRSLPARQVLDGVPIRRWLLLRPSVAGLARGRPDIFLASLYYLPLVLFQMRQLVQAFRPEVVNVHYPDSQIPFVEWLRRRFRFRLVVSLHGYDVERTLSTQHSALSTSLRSLLQEAEAVTACSQYLLDRAIEFEPLVERKGVVARNGIDLDRFEARATPDSSRAYILACGRLSWDKGFDLLLDAYARVARGNRDVDLILAGDGEEKRALEFQAHSLGLDGRIRIAGRVSPEGMVELLNGCDFVVIPSRRESFGIFALEAMAAGKTAVATRVGGLPELLDESCNLLAKPTVDELSQGIDRWLRLHDRLNELGARNRVRSLQYGWHSTVQQYLEAYGWY